MQLVDNSNVARGLVRVTPGEDVLETLQQLAQGAGWREGFVTGCGGFQLVELDAGNGAPVTLENATLLSLSGHLTRHDGEAALAMWATVLSQGERHEGKVVAAVADAMLLMIEGITADAPSRVALTSSVLPTTTPARTAPTPASPKTAEAAGAAEATRPVSVSPASAQRRGGYVPPSQSFRGKPMVRRRPVVTLDDDEDENPMLEAGDLLKHPQLGLCVVEGDDPSGGTKVRVGEGRLRVLRLDALRIDPQPVTDEQGRRVFTCLGPRRRRR